VLQIEVAHASQTIQFDLEAQAAQRAIVECPFAAGEEA
jgi:hypothetical protein